MIRCRGCFKISYKEVTETQSGAIYTTYYPPPISRRRPEWALFMGWFYPGAEKFDDLLTEIYEATENNLSRLALMGIRALSKL